MVMMKKQEPTPKIDFKSEKDMPLAPYSLGLMLHNFTGAWRNIRPEINLKECIQCGICWKFCPDTAIYIENEYPVIDYTYCKGCGLCAEECPTKCITMVEEEK
ncbi:MAG: 2-ketoisovalerate ferredoxin oxidoreductase [Candidatus Aminicenantes bacterium 4484_214]|nr:MAG: 2-ketoisovalerate ferredoxin oxidoreductase [Candidatus Aminicenantes bacterium 4484_214]RLE09418.1 MAG: 2-ketoisovalerate ferredoxin oxidoreductase [Candidatus Aminicenantes bacterium]HDJ24379.1 4Fe-4S dicluster domain-containing protein [Candidatus Aminicenantes bacterium]